MSQHLGLAEGFRPIQGRLGRLAEATRLSYRRAGAGAAARLLLRTGWRQGHTLARQIVARLLANRARQGLRQDWQGLPEATPRLAVAVTGGLGDMLVIGRFLRDLDAQCGGLAFDLYCPRPEQAAWAFAEVPGFLRARHDILFDPLRGEYDLALRLNQMAVIYAETAQWRVLAGNAPLAAVVAALQRARPGLDPFIAAHPRLDNFLAQRAVFEGARRHDYLHRLAGLPYGGDRLGIRADHAAPSRHGLRPGGYVTLHNGFDANFLITGRRATKCYPHFGEVVARLRAARPDLAFVQLGTVTSEPIPGCDLDLINRTSMVETAGLLAGSLLHLDNEGGLVHLATALGTRCAVVFGPTPADYFGYAANINIAPPICGGCWWMTPDWMSHCAKDHPEPICLTRQAPGAVAAAALAALAEAVPA